MFYNKLHNTKKFAYYLIFKTIQIITIYTIIDILYL